MVSRCSSTVELLLEIQKKLDNISDCVKILSNKMDANDRVRNK